jgi:hypothetical protein
MRLRLKADAKGDLYQSDVCISQQFLGALDSLPHHILMRADSGCPFN